jgi:flagellar FliJ protein
MTRTQRLQPVIQHTDNKEKQALKEVARSQGLLEAELLKLSQLEEYKLDYQQKNQNLNSIFSSLQLQEFHRFMAQLDDTMQKQGEVINLRKKELEQKCQSWKETRIGAKVMHKVVENLQQQELVEQDRNDQKELDEFSQRKNNIR